MLNADTIYKEVTDIQRIFSQLNATAYEFLDSLRLI